MTAPDSTPPQPPADPPSGGGGERRSLLRRLADLYEGLDGSGRGSVLAALIGVPVSLAAIFVPLVVLGSSSNSQTAPVVTPSGTASAVLPPYLHIQAEVGGCRPANHYDETLAQYEQHLRKNSWPVGPGTIDIFNQTSSGEAVLLTGMHVLVRHRQPAPTTGITVDDGQCGVAQSVRPFTADLDKPDPVAIAQRDPGGPGDPGHPPVTFPFKISPGDPEVFELTANDTTCDCTIAVEIDWVAAGEAGKTILDNAGHGFRVLAAPNVPAYQLGGLNMDKLIPAKYKDIVLAN